MEITENQARANGRDLPISTKHAIEICNFIRGKPLSKAKKILARVLDMKQAIPMNRFNKDRGHKPGNISAGQYPLKASEEILQLLDGVEANAQNKGLDTASLIIKTIIPNKASRPWHYGRQKRRKTKRTHISIIVEEVKKETSKKETSKKEEHKK